MKLDEIKQAIGEWAKARTSADDVLSYLKQGTCFKIEKSNYDLWKQKSPENLHAYLGVFEGQLQLILVDSESDKKPEENLESFIVQDYYTGLNVLDAGFIDSAKDGNIKVTDALKRVMSWTVFMESWVRNSVESSVGVFQAFIIPFSDLTAQFEESNSFESMVIFGLKGKKADLILWGMPTSIEASRLRAASEEEVAEVAGVAKSVDSGSPVGDLVTPCPPFHDNVLGLL